MQSPVNYPVGAIHDIRFSVHDREPIMLRARTVHVMRASAGEVASYVVGVTFLDRGVTTCEEAIESLVQELGSASE